MLTGLDARARRILVERSGLRGDTRTHSEIPVDLGVTRAWVRALEGDAFRSLRPGAWGREVAARTDALLKNGTRPSLSALAGDSWWASAARRVDVARYVLEHVIEPPTAVMEKFLSRRFPTDGDFGPRERPSAGQARHSAERTPRTKGRRLGVDAEITALGRRFAADLTHVIKIATLDAIAEALRKA